MKSKGKHVGTCTYMVNASKQVLASRGSYAEYNDREPMLRRVRMNVAGFYQ